MLYGQALTVFDRKWTFLFAICVFEIGSLLCGVAPTVEVLIFGRAFAGVGAAGTFVSVLSIVADVTTLEQRPRLLGLFGAVFAISSVIGPLLGGAFTDHATWRWCFYINLPVGAITVVVIFFLLGPQPPAPLSPEIEAYTRGKFQRWTRGRYMPASDSFIFKLAVLDWVGSILMLGLITCLVLALQWGGVTYAWSSGPVVGTLIAFAVLAILFGIWEWKFAGLSQLLPLRLFKNRTQVGACAIAFCIMALLLVGSYFVPIYYIATRGRTASKAGIDILPLMLSITVAAGVSGGIVTGTGRYWHVLLLGPIPTVIGSGLLYTIDAGTSNAKLIGFQLLFGIGIGFVLQQTIIAVQACTEDPKDIPQRHGVDRHCQHDLRLQARLGSRKVRPGCRCDSEVECRGYSRPASGTAAGHQGGLCRGYRHCLSHWHPARRLLLAVRAPHSQQEHQGPDYGNGWLSADSDGVLWSQNVQQSHV